jgi:V/A-type H+-transporting ATPase subunit K
MSLLLNTLANVTPVLAQAADAAQAAAPAQDIPFFEQKALIYAAAFTSIGFAAIGSAYGCGSASCAAMGAWKKCYAQNKPAPFQLLIFAGAPLSQTIYGMIVMFIVMGGASNVAMATAGNWIVYSLVGVLAGIAMGVSALWQGISAAAAADAFAETGKGFANQLMALGIVETVAIFVLAFSIVLLSSLGAA